MNGTAVQATGCRCTRAAPVAICPATAVAATTVEAANAAPATTHGPSTTTAEAASLAAPVTRARISAASRKT